MYHYDNFVSAQYMNIISTEQKLMCPIQWKSIPISLDLPNRASWSEVESNDDKTSPILDHPEYEIRNTWYTVVKTSPLYCSKSSKRGQLNMK
jgi:hypothetical protein